MVEWELEHWPYHSEKNHYIKLAHLFKVGLQEELFQIQCLKRVAFQRSHSSSSQLLKVRTSGTHVPILVFLVLTISEILWEKTKKLLSQIQAVSNILRGEEIQSSPNIKKKTIFYRKVCKTVILICLLYLKIAEGMGGKKKRVRLRRGLTSHHPLPLWQR